MLSIIYKCSWRKKQRMRQKMQISMSNPIASYLEQMLETKTDIRDILKQLCSYKGVEIRANLKYKLPVLRVAATVIE